MDYRLPGNAKIINPNKVSTLDNFAEKMRYLLRHPIGAKPLRMMVRKDNSVAIIISDKTRTLYRKEMLCVILDELSYVNDGNISIVVATGTHRPNSPGEIGLDENITDRVPVYNHNSSDTNNIVSIGFTSPKMNRFSNSKELKEEMVGISHLVNSETSAELFTMEELSSPSEVRINRIVAVADVKILLGNITPHYFAGFSGGIKSLIPGVANREFISKNHFLKLHPSARLGVMEGNVVREDLEEAGKLCSGTFCINTVMNEENKVIEVTAGDPILAHRKGVQTCKEMSCVTVARHDIVIVTDRYPVNINIKQIKKVVAAAAKVVKPNGIIVVLGKCKEGLGSSSKISNFIYKLYLKQILPANVSLLLISDVPENEVKSTGFFDPIPSFEEALRFAYAKLNKNASIAMIPYGSLVIPVIVD